MTEQQDSDQFPIGVDQTSMEYEGAVGIERSPRMVLEICRGRTRFPLRPICGPRFFIGSGAGCDLRLGGEDFPPVHSVIQTLPTGIWFESLATDPPAGINGEPIRGEWLRDGDRIALGSFEFVAKMRNPDPTVNLKAMATSTHSSPQNIRELTASELADKLELEMNRVADYNTGRNAGAKALLAVLKRRTDSGSTKQLQSSRQLVTSPGLPCNTSATNTAADVHQVDLDRVCQELLKLTEMLDRRSESVHQRETQFIELAESLLAAQRDVAQQLENAIEAAMHMSKADTSPKPAIRFSA